MLQKKERRAQNHISQWCLCESDRLLNVRQAERKYVKDCAVIPGEAAVKQRRLLVINMRIQSVKTGHRLKQKPCIRSWKLKGENLVKFKREVQQKMNDQEVTWDKLKYSIVETAKNVCGVTRGQKRRELDTSWWSEDVQGAVKNKKEACKSWQPSHLSCKRSTIVLRVAFFEKNIFSKHVVY